VPDGGYGVRAMAQIARVVDLPGCRMRAVRMAARRWAR